MFTITSKRNYRVPAWLNIYELFYILQNLIVWYVSDDIQTWNIKAPWDYVLAPALI